MKKKPTAPPKDNTIRERALLLFHSPPRNKVNAIAPIVKNKKPIDAVTFKERNCQLTNWAHRLFPKFSCFTLITSNIAVTACLYGA